MRTATHWTLSCQTLTFRIVGFSRLFPFFLSFSFPLLDLCLSDKRSWSGDDRLLREVHDGETGSAERAADPRIGTMLTSRSRRALLH